MSGAAAASNRLMMFSAFISLDGVTFGGGGTAGFSCTETEGGDTAPSGFISACLCRLQGVCYLGWGFGDRRWSSGPESVVGGFFDAEGNADVPHLQGEVPHVAKKRFKREDVSEFPGMLCRSTGATMQGK